MKISMSHVPELGSSHEVGILIGDDEQHERVIYVPILVDERQVRIPVNGGTLGLHAIKRPMLIVNTLTHKHRLVVANIRQHVKSNIHTFTPDKSILDHMLAVPGTFLDLSDSVPDDYQPTSDRYGVFAYSTPVDRGAHIKPRQIYISDRKFHHPFLDAISDEDMQQVLDYIKQTKTWEDLCLDHARGRCKIDAPGIDTYLRYETDIPKYVPEIFAAAWKSLNIINAMPPAEIATRRAEMVTAIEVAMSFDRLWACGPKVTYAGEIPEMRFEWQREEREGQVAATRYMCYCVVPNDLPIPGRFLVIDTQAEGFENRFRPFMSISDALTFVSTEYHKEEV